jgi:hypothetical protein
MQMKDEKTYQKLRDKGSSTMNKGQLTEALRDH